MATSRYPRPLKATLLFSPNSQPPTAGRRPSNGSPAPTPPSPTSCVSGSSARKGAAELRVSPERRSPVPMGSSRAGTEGGEAEGGSHDGSPRRSNSLGCLSDPDTYMSSLWPRLPSPSNTPSEGEDPVVPGDNDFHSFSHKRSNSCSSADGLRRGDGGPQHPNHPMVHPKNGHVGVHTRRSIEGLNQEISSALEGKDLVLHLHPDGHIAPVRDLFGHMTVGTQTPPRISTTHSSPSSSLSPSPYPLPSSPSTTTPTTPQMDLEPHLPPLTLGAPDLPPNPLHPSSPKPSFVDREPPDGAERLTIRTDTIPFCEDYIPLGPDKSKANIVFKGTVFAPLLPSPHLKPLPLQSTATAGSPINGL